MPPEAPLMPPEGRFTFWGRKAPCRRLVRYGAGHG